MPQVFVRMQVGSGLIPLSVRIRGLFRPTVTEIAPCSTMQEPATGCAPSARTGA